MAQVAKVGRNDACSCGSRKKFKKCCEPKPERNRAAPVIAVLVGVTMLGGLLSMAADFSSDAAHEAKTTGVWSPEHGHYH